MSDQSLEALLFATPPWQRAAVEAVLAGERLTPARGRAQQSGKRYASWLAIRMAVARGDVVHVARPGGTFCTGGHDDCDLPAWDGET